MILRDLQITIVLAISSSIIHTGTHASQVKTVLELDGLITQPFMTSIIDDDWSKWLNLTTTDGDVTAQIDDSCYDYRGFTVIYNVSKLANWTSFQDD